MLVSFHPEATPEQMQAVVRHIEQFPELETRLAPGRERTVVDVYGIVGDFGNLLMEQLQSMPGVSQAVRITESYRRLVKRSEPDGKSVVRCGSVSVGGDRFTLFAGPCAVESQDMAFTVAEGLLTAVQDVGIDVNLVFRGGAFKPRTSPYDFQGQGDIAFQALCLVRERFGLPLVSEVMERWDLDMAHAFHVDMVQIGARNSQNFRLLEAVGKDHRFSVLHKRGSCLTLEDYLNAAEYIVKGGNRQIVLCERGVFGPTRETRNVYDIMAIAQLQTMTHLPVIGDPSHATGLRSLVHRGALATAAVGADGLMVEVHPCPEEARSDPRQQLNLAEFRILLEQLKPLLELRGESFARA